MPQQRVVRVTIVFGLRVGTMVTYALGICDRTGLLCSFCYGLFSDFFFFLKRLGKRITYGLCIFRLGNILFPYTHEWNIFFMLCAKICASVKMNVFPTKKNYFTIQGYNSDMLGITDTSIYGICHFPFFYLYIFCARILNWHDLIYRTIQNDPYRCQFNMSDNRDRLAEKAMEIADA